MKKIKVKTVIVKPSAGHENVWANDVLRAFYAALNENDRVSHVVLVITSEASK